MLKAIGQTVPARPRKRARDPYAQVLVVGLPALALGVAIGLAASVTDPVWRVGILIVSVLASAVFALSRAVDPVHQVATAGERSYRAFFEHA
ncbi:MAG TPA: hypothetical protein VIJ62_00140, partial [Rhizomicrobium sp.]